MILGHNTTKHTSKHSDKEHRNCFYFSEAINLYFVLFLLMYIFSSGDEKKQNQTTLVICIHWAGFRAQDYFSFLFCLLATFIFHHFEKGI